MRVETFVLGVAVFGFVCLSVDALSANGHNVCKYTRVQSYTAQNRYTSHCGFLGWKRCTHYSRVTSTRTVTDYKCCGGWTSTNNVHCDQAVCSGSPAGTCPNGGTCVRPGTCACRPGFATPRCADINECGSGNGGCQHKCVNTAGSYKCQCNSGYSLLSDKKSCKPVCYGQTPGVCPNGGTCTGPNKCRCKAGYAIPQCADINECGSGNGGCQHKCVNTAGSYKCQCNAGYSLLSDKKSCKPVCYGQTPGECSNGGTCTGPNKCRCKAGYALPQCADVNECSSDNGGCSQTCTNTVGSFTCGCKSGYQLDTDGRTCKDINECLTSNGGCEQECENTVGSFRCKCPSGYLLADDGKACSVISPPVLLSRLPTRLEVAVGDNVSVVCNVSATPKAHIRWVMKSDDRFRMENATLQLSDVQLSNAGVYKCNADNQYGRISSNEVTLVVQEASAKVSDVKVG